MVNTDIAGLLDLDRIVKQECCKDSAMLWQPLLSLFKHAAFDLPALLQEYDTALENQEYQEAARLRDEAAVGLRGWWYLQSSSTENPSHLLRIRQAFDRYVLLAYSPQDIAAIHVCSHPPALRFDSTFSNRCLCDAFLRAMAQLFMT